MPAVSVLSRLRLPRPAAASASCFSGATAPGSGGRLGVGSLPEMAMPDFGGMPSGGALRGHRKAEHRIGGTQRGGELRVVVAAEPVGLGEQHVEADGGGAEFAEPVGERRELRPRPRPLAVLGERWLIDVDDPHRGVVGGTRQQALLEIEADIADGGNRQRIAEPQQRQQHHQGKTQQCRQQPATDHKL